MGWRDASTHSGRVHSFVASEGYGGTRLCALVLSGVNRSSLNGSEILVSHVRLRRLRVDDGSKKRIGQGDSARSGSLRVSRVHEALSFFGNVFVVTTNIVFVWSVFVLTLTCAVVAVLLVFSALCFRS